MREQTTRCGDASQGSCLTPAFCFRVTLNSQDACTIVTTPVASAKDVSAACRVEGGEWHLRHGGVISLLCLQPAQKFVGKDGPVAKHAVIWLHRDNDKSTHSAGPL